MKVIDKIEKYDLSLTQQNYVEVIAELVEKHGHAHPSEIARMMNVKKPSVTEAVSRLEGQGIVSRVGQKVLLTSKGMQIADELSYKHETIRNFMAEVLDMNNKTADSAACRLEHSAGSEFTGRLLLLYEFMKNEMPAKCQNEWKKKLQKLESLG